MRLQRRNLVQVWYCLYKERVPLLDENGFETGEYKVKYDEPVRLMCSVSPATGYAQGEMFGNLESYDKVILTDNIDCPIDENSVLYIDCEPSEGTAFDYTVKRVAKSLNSISYAVGKVKVQ